MQQPQERKRLKVLQLHCWYVTNPVSGENSSVELLGDTLATEDDVTRVYRRTEENGLLSKIRLALNYVRLDKQLLDLAVAHDVVVVHNTIPHFGFRTLKALTRVRPVVKVWHNHRSMCVSGTEFRSGRECTLCSTSVMGRLNGIARRCYQNSFVASALVSFTESSLLRLRIMHRMTHVVPSHYMQRRIAALGLTSTVIAEGLDIASATSRSVGRDFIYVGRLDQEKGVENLLRAWTLLPPRIKSGRSLHLVGDGEDRARLETCFSRDDVTFHGRLTRERTTQISLGCGVCVLPSLVKESFGRAAFEALSLGLRIIVPSHGASPEAIRGPADGRTCGGGSPRELETALRLELDDSNLPRPDHVGVRERFNLERWGVAWRRLLESATAHV